ncbi:MAG: GspE/PulE family protein [Chitinispirillaceae bacterium]
MSSASPKRNAVPFSVALLGYSETGFDYLNKLIKFVDMSKPLNVVRSNLSKHQGIDSDIAIAVFDKSADLGQFGRDIASLRQLKKSRVVLCAAHEKDRKFLEDHRHEIPADDILYLPLKPDQFSKAINTHMVSFRIREKDSVRTELNRNSRLFGQMLVEHKLLTALDLNKALEHQRSTGQRLGDILVELGFIDEDQKITFLSSQLDIPVASARQYAATDLNIVALIPEHMARRFNCIALEKNGDQLTVAMTDVNDLRLLDMLRDATDMRILAILGKKEDISTSIDRYYRDISSHKDASKLVADLGNDVEYIKSREDEMDLDQMAAAGAELGIIKLVNMLITNAIRDKASDIHIEPMDKELTVRYRIDGDMRRVMSPPKRSHHAIVARIKILSDLNIAERRLPQDGRMVIKIGHREVDIRVSILPTIFGEKAVLRILDKEAFEQSTSNLGFTSYDESIFRSQITKPYGMIIVTGPTGSGKSTTLYSALQIVKNVTRNIITVEDPVEFHMEGINQVNVNTKIGLTFATALRSILRQDPDIVLIGEIRDEETADIAIKMALTGHLVFSTLHTNDAASSIARFVDIGIPPLLLGSSLNLVIAQRLVRKICPRCKTQYAPDPELLESLGLNPGEVPFLFKGSGCVSCNGTGYSGRTGVFELLTVSKSIRKMVLKNSSTIDIQEQAEKEGMKTLRKAGLEMATRGITTIEQIIAATTEI